MRSWAREVERIRPRVRDPTPAVFQILLALAEGERHGYAIMQAVAAETERLLSMGPGTLYGARAPRTRPV